MSREEILKILKAFKEECAGRYGILTLGVFGSVARDDVKEASDVDVVLRTKTPDITLCISKRIWSNVST